MTIFLRRQDGQRLPSRNFTAVHRRLHGNDQKHLLTTCSTPTAERTSLLPRALTRVINDYARKNGLLKEKEENLSGKTPRRHDGYYPC